MTRIEVLNPDWFDEGALNSAGNQYDAVLEHRPNGDDIYRAINSRYAWVWYTHNVRVLGKHEGEYNPNHWGELNPDAYDRSGYNARRAYGIAEWEKSFLHGRHLLDSGVN